MKNLRWLIQVVILMVALTVGLLLGLGISRVQIKNEQQSCADKMKEANRKIAFMQKKDDRGKSSDCHSQRTAVLG
jgi:uncharacterized protein YneF (UPF0154 family)